MGSRREQKAPTSGRMEEPGQGGERARRGAEVHPGLHHCDGSAVCCIPAQQLLHRWALPLTEHAMTPCHPVFILCPLTFPDSNSTREPILRELILPSARPYTVAFGSECPWVRAPTCSQEGARPCGPAKLLVPEELGLKRRKYLTGRGYGLADTQWNT